MKKELKPKEIHLVYGRKELEDFFNLFGHELALGLKHAMQDETLRIEINLESDALYDLSYQFERIAKAFEKIEEKLCK